MKSSGDRRTSARLEVVGPLWGTFHFNVPVRIVDASALGVLIASPIRFPAESIQQLCINGGDHEFRIDARVCHARAADQAGQELIGLEFLPAASNLPR